MENNIQRLEGEIQSGLNGINHRINSGSISIRIEFDSQEDFDNGISRLENMEIDNPSDGIQEGIISLRFGDQDFFLD